MPPEIRVIGVEGMPEVVAGDDLSAQIMDASQTQGTAIESGDVLVVTQKIVSKAEGRVVDLRDVEPTDFATNLAGPLSFCCSARPTTRGQNWSTGPMR